MKENIISFFILNIFLLGCSSDNNSSEVDETFTVSGKVVDSDGSGLANTTTHHLCQSPGHVSTSVQVPTNMYLLSLRQRSRFST